MNIGVQHELKPGTVVSVDLLANIGTHTLLAIDENHVGDARFLDQAGALGAIQRPLIRSFACAGTSAATSIAPSPWSNDLRLSNNG